MSIKVMSLIWEHYPAGGGELLTALGYADHAHDNGSGIRPSIAYMAKKTRQSERTIQMHVAAMRRTTWLLTVRYASGGRGRVTEYRINPEWISNPAGFAPFRQASQSVQSATGKSATDGEKGCKAFAPQPPRTVIEPTTPALGIYEPSVVVVPDGLRLPHVLERDAAASAQRLLTQCPAALHQAVLDEVAGLAERGAVRHPLGLLRRLVELAVKGDFVPSAGIEYRRALKRQADERERRAADELDRQMRCTPEAREAGRRAIAEVRAKLDSMPKNARQPPSCPSVAAGGVGVEP